MDPKKIRRIVALGIFIVSFLTYASTAQSSVPFWDCGEFTATAYTLAVPHPPGAPFFLILGRFVGMLLFFVGDPALRLNLISAFASAVCVLFLFLICVRLIEKWRGSPKSLIDHLIIVGASAVGALSFNFSDTFWFNAVESEVYASSMFFVSCVVWLGMVWYEKADTAGSEKYLILAAYLIGLSMGIHQLSLLVYFSIAMFVFFRHYEFDLKRFLYFGAISVFGFFVIYPGIVNWIPDVLDGSFELGPINIADSDLLRISPLLLVAGLGYGAYHSAVNKKKILNLVMLSLLLMIVGYTTFAQVVIRANAKPPINENNPDNMARFVSYMNREQYGESPPLLKRRWSPEPQHQANYRKYTSDWDYFLKYQLGHMYLRYLAWNFIGRSGDIQDAPAALLKGEEGWSEGRGFPNRYFALPFLLGLFGLLHHFKKDWKFALSFLALFLVMGLALVAYFNMAEAQPRERDYFFVGSFFVFAIWIGVGTAGALEYLERKFQNMDRLPLVIGAGGAFLLFVVPVNMGVQNFYDHDRHGNYVPWDYSYNILQSCEKDAVLFTNGDNDTFPLWYLQEVEGVRTDVRVANLSLLNTPWYILQLKNEEPHGAKKVAMSLSDVQIENLRLSSWTERDIDVAVPKEVFAEYGIKDTSITNKGKITFRMPPSLQGTDAQGKPVGAIRIQDIMVRDIILNAKWQRPVYFAVTVSPDGLIGMGDYMRMEGLAMKFTPVKGNTQYDFRQITETALRESLLNEPNGFYREPHRGFRFRGLNNPKIYFNEQDRRLMANYRNSFMRLALYYANVVGDTGKTAEVMETMEKKISRSVFPMDWRTMSDIARIYSWVGSKQRFDEYANEVEAQCWDLINRGQANPTLESNPYRALIEIYSERKDYQKEMDVLKRVQKQYPNDQGLRQRISELENLVQAQTAPTATEPTKPGSGKN
jgi:hypothetical protein